MAKVNLRNRLKDNKDDNPPPKRGTDSLLNQLDSISVENPFSDLANNKEPEVTLKAPVIETPKAVEKPSIPKPQPKMEVPVIDEFEDIQAPQVPPPAQENPVNSRLKKIEKPVDNSEPLRVGKKAQTDIFKDLDLEGDDKTKNFKSFFGSNKGNKEEEGENALNPEKQNIFDKLNINKKMFFTAVGISSVAALLVIGYLNSIGDEKLFGSNMVNVLVAGKDIPEKKVIEISDLAQKEIPEKFVLKDTIRIDEKFDPKTLVGKVAVTDISEKEQLLSKRIVAADESPWLSPVVPTNYRAVSIASRSLAYIKPKDYVDVFVAIEDPLDKRRINEPVIQNALVLAVDGKYKVTQSDHETPGENITIAIPNNLVNLFSLLQERGNFHIALRGQGDKTIIKTRLSAAQLELMLSASSIKMEKSEMPDYIPPKPKPTPRAEVEDVNPYIPPPAAVYRPPVYNPPAPRNYYKPAVSRPVTVKPKPAVVKQVEKAPAPAPTTVSVFVINGNNISKQQAPKQEK